MNGTVHNQRIFGCIEAGGTKCIVAVMGDDRTVLEQVRIPTTYADETISACENWLLDAQSRHGRFSALGIASFGPLELDRAAPNWGFITATTKPGWGNNDFAGRLLRRFALPVGFDTDVNGAALAESRWGALKGHRTGVYITVGTGIGGGAVVDGAIMRGLSHPEMGHFMPRRHPLDPEGSFAGVCPFHGDCLEGLASGPAVIARWGQSLSHLAPDHIAHEIIAYYLAQAVVALQAMMEPGRIVIGGGVSSGPGLLDRVSKTAHALGKGYFRGDGRSIVWPPILGDRSGIMGALALAQDSLSPRDRTGAGAGHSTVAGDSGRFSLIRG